MTLNIDDRNSLIQYRLDKAREALEQVNEVGKLGYWTLAANRLYYAAYYACVALLISESIETTTHRGVIRMINLHFVKEGKISLEDGKMLGRLFAMRQSGDYEDWVEWGEEDVKPLIPRAEVFINNIEAIII